MSHVAYWREYREQSDLPISAPPDAPDCRFLSVVVAEALKGVDIAARLAVYCQKVVASAELRQPFLDCLDRLESERSGRLTPLPEEISPSPRLSGQQGQALVETAIIFPILFLVILGTIDMVFVMMDHFALTRVAREVVRDAAYLGGYDAEVEAALVEELQQARIERDQVVFEVMVYRYHPTSGSFQLKPDCQPNEVGLYLCRAGFGHDERVRVRLQKEWTFNAFGLLQVAHGTHDITQGSRGWRSE
jgi:hypothetical protein